MRCPRWLLALATALMPGMGCAAAQSDLGLWLAQAPGPIPAKAKSGAGQALFGSAGDRPAGGQLAHRHGPEFRPHGPDTGF